MKYDLSDVLDEKYQHVLDKATSVGIDIGSRGSKAVMLHEGQLYTQIMPSGVSSRETSRYLLDELLKEAGIEKNDLEGIIGTGYGSIVMDIKDVPLNTITEITCHALGAHYLHSQVKTVIDIGGQDSKTIKISPLDGHVLDFVMNEKCAAGTGRFLEKVAHILDISLDDLGDMVLKSENPAEISSQCVVFAESEVISLKATGCPREDIAYGIHLATARRIKSLLKKTGFEKDILFTGGVSNNKGMRRALEAVLGESLSEVGFDMTFAGAIGAAIIAHNNFCNSASF